MPAPIENLRKFLNLEIKRNYDNRAIVGGLDKIDPVWQQDARLYGITDELRESISKKLLTYSNLPIENRPQAVEEMLDQLNGNAVPTAVTNDSPQKVEAQIAESLPPRVPEVPTPSAKPQTAVRESPP